MSKITNALLIADIANNSVIAKENQRLMKMTEEERVQERIREENSAVNKIANGVNSYIRETIIAFFVIILAIALIQDYWYIIIPAGLAILGLYIFLHNLKMKAIDREFGGDDH